MKEVILTLRLRFSEKITSDEDLKEVTDNVVNALRHECDSGSGLAPQDSDAFTVFIIAENETLGVCSVAKLYEQDV